MATLRQIEANRRNAQNSTGPRTEAGKAISRLNALKSGVDAELDIIPGEEPAGLKQLTAEYFGRFQPTTPETRFLVDTLITNDWLLRRLRRAEANLWEHEIDDTFERHEYPIALAVDNQADVFERIQRRMNAVQRNYVRALAELHRLPPDSPQPSVARPVSTTPPAPELTLAPVTIPAVAPAKPTPPPIGFVPPHSPVPVPEGVLASNQRLTPPVPCSAARP